MGGRGSRRATIGEDGSGHPKGIAGFGRRRGASCNNCGRIVTSRLGGSLALPENRAISFRTGSTCRIAILVALFAVFLSTGRALAQSPPVRQLDKEAERVRSEYLDRLNKLATAYDEAGETDKAKATLRQILDIDPQAEAAQEKLDELENRVFDQKTVTVDVDVSRGWFSTGLLVEEGKPIRFEADGSYKLIANATLDPDGYPTADLSRDVVSGIDFGKLMGLVVARPKGANRNRKQKPRPGTPFAVGTKTEVTPETDGVLFLRLNIPAGTKSNGKVKVTVSGNIRSKPGSPSG